MKKILAISVAPIIAKGDLAICRASLDQLKDLGTLKLCCPLYHAPRDFVSKFLGDIELLPHPSELTLLKDRYRRLLKGGSSLKQKSVSAPVARPTPNMTLRSILSSVYNMSHLPKVVTPLMTESFFNQLHPDLDDIDIAVVLGHTLEKSGLIQDAVSYLYPKFVLRKPTVIFPFSVSRLGLKESPKKLVSLIEMALRNVDIIFLREGRSYKCLIETIGTRKNVFQASDTAFLLSEAPISNVISKIDKLGIDKQKPAIGVTLRSDYFRIYQERYGQARYSLFIKKIALLLDRIIQKYDASIYFIPMTVDPTGSTSDDLHCSKECKRYLQNPEKAHVINTLWMSTYEIKTLFGLIDFLITMRLHAGILAMSKYVPTAMILPAHDHKATGISERLDVKNCFIDLDYAIKTESDKLYLTISKLIDNQDTIRQILKTTIPQEQKLAAIPRTILKRILA
jgi:polysaccharide pyruvyl transferase WcaK-like protein